MSLASARAALFAASLASACETQHEHTCQPWMESGKGSSLREDMPSEFKEVENFTPKKKKKQKKRDNLHECIWLLKPSTSCNGKKRHSGKFSHALISFQVPMSGPVKARLLLPAGTKLTQPLMTSLIQSYRCMVWFIIQIIKMTKEDKDCCLFSHARASLKNNNGRRQKHTTCFHIAIIQHHHKVQPVCWPWMELHSGLVNGFLCALWVLGTTSCVNHQFQEDSLKGLTRQMQMRGRPTVQRNNQATCNSLELHSQ